MFWSKPPLARLELVTQQNRKVSASVTGPPRFPHKSENRRGWDRERERRQTWRIEWGQRKQMEKMNITGRNKVLPCQKRFRNNNSNTPAYPALHQEKNVYLYNSLNCYSKEPRTKSYFPIGFTVETFTGPCHLVNRPSKTWLPQGLKHGWLGFHLRHKACQSSAAQRETQTWERKSDGQRERLKLQFWWGKEELVLTVGDVSKGAMRVHAFTQPLPNQTEQQHTHGATYI